MLKTFMSLPQPMPESILDQFPCPVSKIDRNYYILYRNTASVRSNGPTPPEAYARHCYEWIGRSERCPQCAVAQAFASGHVETQEKLNFTEDQRLVRLEQTAIPVFAANGEIAYVLEVDLDTTATLALQQDNETTFTQTIFAFAELIEKRDAYTGRHSANTCSIALKLGQQLGLPSNKLDDLSTAALLHDIGKIGIPESVLLKPGRLTETERLQIQEHPRIGYDVLCKVNRFAHLADYVLYHHEWMNGSGYPTQRSGDDIPLLARILSVADVFEALTAHRVYRPAMSKEQALSIIQQGCGSQFDEKVVDCLLSLPDIH